VQDPLLICWNCLGRTPEGTCIHCGKEVSKAGAIDDTEDKNLQYVIQIRQRNGDKKEFELRQLTEIVETEFEVMSQQFLPTGPIFIVKQPELKQFSYQNLSVKCSDLAPGLTPIIKQPRRHVKYVKLRLPKDYAIVEFKFVPNTEPKKSRLPFISFMLTLFSVIFAGALTSTRYEYITTHEVLPTFDFNHLDVFLSVDITVNTAIFLGVIFTIMSINYITFKLIKKYLNTPPMRMIFLPTIIPYFEIGTLGSLRIEFNAYRTRSLYFINAFLPNFITWLAAVLILGFTLPLGTMGDAIASKFSDNSLISSGKFEPFILNFIAFLWSFAGLSPLPITQHMVLHPASLAALSMVYIYGFQMLPITQMNGGAMVEILFGRVSVYLTSILVMGLLFYIGMWWLLIINFFLFRLSSESPVLNEISKLPKYSGLLTIFAIILGVLSLPIPL